MESDKDEVTKNLLAFNYKILSNLYKNMSDKSEWRKWRMLFVTNPTILQIQTQDLWLSWCLTILLGLQQTTYPA